MRRSGQVGRTRRLSQRSWPAISQTQSVSRPTHSTSTGREDVSDCDILDKSRVDTAPLDDCLEDVAEEVLRAGILEAALPGLGDGCPDGGACVGSGSNPHCQNCVLGSVSPHSGLPSLSIACPSSRWPGPPAQRGATSGDLDKGAGKGNREEKSATHR